MRSVGPNLQLHRKVVGFEECAVAQDEEVSALAIPTERISCPLFEHENEGNGVGAPTLQYKRSNGQDTFVGSLEQLVASRFLYRKLPTLDQVAALTGISPRSIQRCLQEEGLSYRRLLDRICVDAAREMLLSRQPTIQEIAWELGYSGTNNFVRGFRRITGITPAEYRRRHVGE